MYIFLSVSALQMVEHLFCTQPASNIKSGFFPKNMFVLFYLSNYYYLQTTWTKFIVQFQMYSFTHWLINFLLLVYTQRFCFSRLKRTILCWEAQMFQWFHWSTAWNWLYHQLLYKRGLKEHTLNWKELFQRICGFNSPFIWSKDKTIIL